MLCYLLVDLGWIHIVEVLTLHGTEFLLSRIANRMLATSIPAWA